MKSCSRRQTRAVAGAGTIGEQVASDQSEWATCRGYYSCSTVLLLYCSLLHCKSVMSGFLSTWVGLFSGERVFKNTPTSLFEHPLKFIAHGRIFESLRYNCLRHIHGIWLECDLVVHVHYGRLGDIIHSGVKEVWDNFSEQTAMIKPCYWLYYAP